MTCSGSHNLLYRPFYGVSGRLVNGEMDRPLPGVEFGKSQMYHGRRQSQQATVLESELRSEYTNMERHRAFE
jgi:hypothetical protein